MAQRIARIEGLSIPDAQFAPVVHPTACIAEDVTITTGSYVGPHTVIMPGARVGQRTSLRANNYISHEVCIGD